MSKRMLFLAALSIGLAGCYPAERNVAYGTATGAAVGGVVGHNLYDDAGVGAIIGGLFGGTAAAGYYGYPGPYYPPPAPYYAYPPPYAYPYPYPYVRRYVYYDSHHSRHGYKPYNNHGHGNPSHGKSQPPPSSYYKQGGKGH